MNKSSFLGIVIVLVLLLPLVFSCGSKETMQDEQEAQAQQEPQYQQESHSCWQERPPLTPPRGRGIR